MSLLMSMQLTKRVYGGAYVKGSWVKNAEPVDTPFKGTAQPVNGKAMELLPEGKKNTEAILVFAPIEMEFTPADSEKQVSGDLIIYGDSHYEVVNVKPWKVGLIPHLELVASKV